MKELLRQLEEIANDQFISNVEFTKVFDLDYPDDSYKIIDAVVSLTRKNQNLEEFYLECSYLHKRICRTLIFKHNDNGEIVVTPYNNDNSFDEYEFAALCFPDEEIIIPMYRENNFLIDLEFDALIREIYEENKVRVDLYQISDQQFEKLLNLNTELLNNIDFINIHRRRLQLILCNKIISAKYHNDEELAQVLIKIANINGINYENFEFNCFANFEAKDSFLHGSKVNIGADVPRHCFLFESFAQYDPKKDLWLQILEKDKVGILGNLLDKYDIVEDGIECLKGLYEKAQELEATNCAAELKLRI